jgi:hypothetical protein
MISVQYNYRDIVREFSVGVRNEQSVRTAVIEAVVDTDMSRPRNDIFKNFILERVAGLEVLGTGISVRDKEKLLSCFNVKTVFEEICN